MAQRRGMWVGALLLLAAVAGVVATAGGCLRSTSFACQSAEQCEPGTCVAAAGGASYCAIADGACASGLRFTESAGGHAGECTDGGGANDAGLDGSSDATDGGGDAPDGPMLSAERSENLCHEGAPFPAGYSECTEVVCERLPGCCESSWTELCVQLVELECAGAGWRCSTSVVFAGTGIVQVWEDGDEDEVWELVASGGAGGGAPAPYRSVCDADLDGDGRLEMIVPSASPLSAGDNQHLVLHRDLTDTSLLVEYRDLLDIQTLLDNANAYEAVIGDYNGDGRADMLLAGNSSAFIIRNLGDGLYADGPFPPELPVAYDVGSIDAGDLDGDHRDDIVVADYSGHVGIFSWDGDALVWSPVELTFPNVVHRVALGPFDPDGDLDLAVSGYDFIHVYENEGGTIADEPIWIYAPGGGSPPAFTDIEWIDANNDGYFDLLAGDRNGDLRVFEGTATGLQLAPRWVSPTPQPSWGLAVGDVDHDGDIDLVGVSETGENFVYRNDTPTEEEITFRKVWADPIPKGGEFYGADLTSF
jgi:hypothetical protein